MAPRLRQSLDPGNGAGSAGKLRHRPWLLFASNSTAFPSGSTRSRSKGTNATTSEQGEIFVDNVVVQNVKPFPAMPYLNATAILWDQDAATYGDEWSVFDVADPRWPVAVSQSDGACVSSGRTPLHTTA